MSPLSQPLPSPSIVAILAGGKARRFGGQDKGEILIRGERLIDIICERLGPQSTEILLSGTHDYSLDLTVVPDAQNAPGGPVGGVYSIWKSQEGRGIEGFFTAAIDGPNLPQDLTASLYSKTCSTIAVDENGRHPTYGWWRMDDLSALWEMTELSESISLNKLADLIGARAVLWEGGSSFTNINRQDDLDCFVKGA
ncbi:MAG: NTP transferase domain-containing protein [Hellea sp.]